MHVCTYVCLYDAGVEYGSFISPIPTVVLSPSPLIEVITVLNLSIKLFDRYTQVANLRHQLSVSQTQENELKIELEEVRERLINQGFGGGNKMRESEDRFLREEKLREALER
jgi:hypothetical protein